MDIEKQKKIAEEKLSSLKSSREEGEKNKDKKPEDKTTDVNKEQKIEPLKPIRTVNLKAKDESIEKEAAAALEQRAKEDERIISADEKTLTESDKVRRQELIKSKEVKDKEDQKKKADEFKAKEDPLAQEEIKKLKEQLANEQEARKQDIEKQRILEEKIDRIEKGLVKPSDDNAIKDKVKQQEEQRILKYLEEDSSLPREQRREITKEELDEWYLEDPVEATSWINERSLRRVSERNKDFNALSKPQVDLKDFEVKQNESAKKLVAKYPGVNPDKNRILALRAEGKDDEAIHQILMKENEQYRLCVEIAKSDPQKYIARVDGPELVMQEMEKRLNGKAKKTVTMTEEEVEAIKQQAREEAVEAEKARLASIDEGVPSHQRSQLKDTRSSFQKQQEEIARRAGISPQRLKELNDRRKTIPGASIYAGT